MDGDPGKPASQFRVESDYTVYDLFIVATTLLSLPVLLIMVLPGVKEDTRWIARFLDGVLSLVFMGDFIHSLATAPDKRAYLKWGWLDFLGSLPGLPTFRVLRLARLIRIVRILRRYGGKEMWQKYRERRAESVFWTTVLIALLFLVVVSLRILDVEEVSTEASIVTASDAVWWALVTMTTVGYGDRVPSTAQGRVLGVALMTVGVMMVSVMTGYVTAKLYVWSGSKDSEGARRDEEAARMLQETIQMREELAQANAKLDAISRLLEAEEDL